MTLSVKGKSAALCICVFERCSSLQQSKHLEVLNTPDDCSRIPQQPITAPLPGCSQPIGRLDGTQEVQSEFIETERDWRQRRRTQKRVFSQKDVLFYKTVDVNQSIVSVRVLCRPSERPSREVSICVLSFSSCSLRPEITILCAEPLSSTSWFPGASAGFPPPPPPAAQIWGPTIPPSIQPPPSYEETDPGSAPDPRPANQHSAWHQTHTFPPLLILKRTNGIGLLKLSAPPPISSEVRVQTLVKLRDDGTATLAARTGSDPAKQEVSQGKYLQELLEAFSADDWGFPDRRSQQQVADGSCGDFPATKRPETRPELRPEPKPRPRLEKNKSAPPTVAPKPKNVAQAAKPSCKRFWEEVAETDLTPEPDSCVLKSEPVVVPVKNTEKPSISPKPQTTTDPPPPSAGPVPAPRPPPHPKLTPSVSETQAKPPPRPPVAPRASVGAPPQEKSSSAGQRTPTLPPRPSVELSSGSHSETGSEETQDAAKQTVKVGSLRPDVPTKPAALTAPRRASAPNLAPRPSAASLAPKPSGPSPVPTPAIKPPAPAIKPPTPAIKPPTPAPALRKGPVIQTKPETSVTATSDPPLPPRPSGVKLLPLRPPPIKSTPGRPPPPALSSSANQTPPASKTSPAPSVSSANPSTNQVPPQRASKRGPPLPPRPKPGHPLYNSYEKQEVLIVLDDPSPSEDQSDEGKSQTAVIDLSQSLLDLDSQPEPAPDQESQSKSDLEGLSLSDSQSILPVESSEQKEQLNPPPVSGPRCVALFDYEGEEEDELTFSQGDVIALLELIGQDWGRGQIHGRIGIFPLNFAEVVEPPEEKPTTTESTVTGTAPETSLDPDAQTAVEEWVEALFDFPGQTAEDLSFQQGALILVMEHIDADWRRGKLGGKEGVGDVITQVEFVDEQWILGDVGGKRGIVPKNYISLL
ncbi:SH3 domain containing protein 19 [Dissostichus eleginoides]|uniref:SH3 domain containing protein 19 n=1 Tax=Dissostichus eleginoides TaxID=100907 RepID=A0AAD9BSQ0_DISEL|nr:SH3 domain containing protein 19 [Dissostichus eleginoides]